MSDNRKQIVRSLIRAFATVFPDTMVGTAKTSPGSSLKTLAGMSPRTSNMEEINTPAATAGGMSPSLQLNSQLAGLGAKCVQVQPFQQVQQHAKMMQQVLQQSNGTSTTEDQKSQFIMTQAVPQQMQQVSVNQQLQQQGYQSEPVTCWKQFCFLKNSVEANPQVSNCVIVKCLLFLVQLRRITEAIENNTTNIQGEFPLGC